jgi:hypothetical protein
MKKIYFTPEIKIEKCIYANHLLESTYIGGGDDDEDLSAKGSFGFWDADDEDEE